MLLGLAVNVTLVPAQIEPFGFALMLTVGVIEVVTTMVIVLLVAVVVLRQVPPLTVITQLTWSAFANAAFVYVDEFAPTLPPFSFHW